MLDLAREDRAGRARRGVLEAAAEALRDSRRDCARRVAPGARPLRTLLWENPVRELRHHAAPYPIWVDRQRALFSAWYEFFPALRGRRGRTGRHAGPARHVRDRGPAAAGVAAMGFDVVYLPPIHPIGKVNRKGRNNTLVARPGRRRLAVGDRLGRGRPRRDPPRARHAGGLRRLRRARPASWAWRSRSTWRCSAAPDHPWVTEHPEWFTTRADGTIAYAENPPKKYQDIYPLNFDNDPDGHLRRGAAGRAALGRATASRSSGSTTRTPSRSTSGTG